MYYKVINTTIKNKGKYYRIGDIVELIEQEALRALNLGEIVQEELPKKKHKKHKKVLKE